MGQNWGGQNFEIQFKMEPKATKKAKSGQNRPDRNIRFVAKMKEI